MCCASVIDIRTTWAVISPKFIRDKRPEVVVKLCHLLSLVPKLALDSAEYEEFTKDVCILLWNWSGNSTIKNFANEEALKALEKFDNSKFQLKMLPTYAKQGHKLPEKFAATPMEAARKPEDVLDYVPALAWVKLATGCPRTMAKHVENFLKAVVSREVMGLPKGIYMTAIQEARKRGHKALSGGQPEPPQIIVSFQKRRF